MRSLSVERAISDLGQDLRTARVRRRMTIDDMADRAGVNRKTIMKIEKGDASVSLSVLGSVLLVLGEEKRLAALLDPGKDDTAILMDQERLPQRVRPRRPKPDPEAPAPDEAAPDDDGFGMGF